MQVVLDGNTLTSAADVYDAIGAMIGVPSWFGNNPDALWDVLNDRGPSDLEVVWRDAAHSAARLGADYERLVAVLRAADEEGLLSLRIE
jgi:RNAse (barnase) inhibitor barstar